MSVRVACIADVHFQLKARKGNETRLPFYCLHAKSSRLENEKETSASQASVSACMSPVFNRFILGL